MNTSPAPSTAAKVGFPDPPFATVVSSPAKLTLCAPAGIENALSSNTSAHTAASARPASLGCNRGPVALAAEEDTQSGELAKQVSGTRHADIGFIEGLLEFDS